MCASLLLGFGFRSLLVLYWFDCVVVFVLFVLLLLFVWLLLLVVVGMVCYIETTTTPHQQTLDVVVGVVCLYFMICVCVLLGGCVRGCSLCC